MPKPTKQPAQDPHGYPIDLERPIVTDEEGVHTELSATEKLGDKWVNFPTIWDGKRLDPRKDEDYDYIMRRLEEEKAKGWKFPEFDSLEAAEAAAEERSKHIGKLREREIREAEKRLWDEEAAKRRK